MCISISENCAWILLSTLIYTHIKLEPLDRFLWKLIKVNFIKSVRTCEFKFRCDTNSWQYRNTCSILLSLRWCVVSSDTSAQSSILRKKSAFVIGTPTFWRWIDGQIHAVLSDKFSVFIYVSFLACLIKLSPAHNYSKAHLQTRMTCISYGQQSAILKLWLCCDPVSSSQSITAEDWGRPQNQEKWDLWWTSICL